MTDKTDTHYCSHSAQCIQDARWLWSSHLLCSVHGFFLFNEASPFPLSSISQGLWISAYWQELLSFTLQTEVGKNMTFCPDKCCFLKGINFAGVRYVLICRRGIDTDDTSKQLLWQLFLEPWKICLTARIKFVEFQLKMCGQEGVA